MPIVNKTDDLDSAAGARRGIQSVEIGMRLFEALKQAGGPATLKELAQASGLPASNCHRYLVSFTRTGFVKQDPRTSRYEFGPKIMQAGLAALSRVDSVAIGNAALSELVDETGYTGLLAIWSDAGAMIVRWIMGRLAVRTTLAVGSSLPLLTSATGHVFLAYLPHRQTDALVSRNRAETAAREALIAQVRATGIAQVAGDHIPGLSAAAAPILDAQGEAAAVLTLVGLSEGIAQAALDRLTAVAASASTELGWTPRDPA